MRDCRAKNKARRWWIAGFCGLAAGALSSPALAQSGTASTGSADRTVIGTEQPIGEPEIDPGEQTQPVDPVIEDDMVSFSAFSDALDLVDLVDMVASILGLNVNIDPGLSGQVMFNSGFSVPRDQLLDTLNSLLEQNGYLITQDPKTGFYAVRANSDVQVLFDGGPSGLETTRLIPTEGVRPSALTNTLNTMLGLGPNPGVGGGKDVRIAYLDDASLIAVTGTPGKIAQVQAIVDAVIGEFLSMQFVRFELVEIAAPVAREYIISIVTGEDPGGQGFQQNIRQVQVPQGQIPGLSGSLDSIPDRLRVDPVGNALLFRGRPEELGHVQTLIAMIDKPSTLSHKRFFTGSATMMVARFASSQGLGEVVTYEQVQNQQPQGLNRTNVNPQQNFQRGGAAMQIRGGPVLVVDEQRGFIIHYATNAQHGSLENLVEQLDAPSEEVVIRPYKLEHALAVDIADLLTGILQEQQVRRDGDGSLLPQNQGPGNQAQPGRRSTPIDPDRLEEDPGVIFVPARPDDVFVVADEDHNQVLVKASVGQQREVAKLIEALDIRQAQVFLDVKIVTISNTDSFRLAVESQIMNANGQPVVQTNFGLTTPGANGILDPRLVNPGLAGLTTAVILSDQVPFVLNALRSVTDARIMANPTLIVNDNAEGMISDIRIEPFQTRTINQNSESVTADEREAGTTVTVTPRISSGGYLTLEYEIIFSNFIGQGTEFLPPSSLNRTVRSVASIPTDSTMVLGGIVTNENSKTVIKVPLLGDIPLIGHLFRDTTIQANDSLLYIFITPRILRDRTFDGHRLISEGPMNIAEIAPDAPPLEPVMIPIIERRITMPTGAEPVVGLGEGG